MGLVQARDVGIHGRGTNLVVISIIFTLVAAGFVFGRFFSRMTSGRILHYDDWVILTSLLFSIGLVVANCISVDHGIGKVGASISREDHRIALEAFVAVQILYKFTINLTKVSILMMYLRIFPDRSFRRGVYGGLVFIIGYAFASIMATIFQCSPIAKSFDHSIEGHCLNVTAFWYSNASANFIGDLLILALPIRVVKGLHLPKAQKWGLMLVFSLGGFVCITSIVRMTTLDPASKALDITHGTLNSTIWSVIEANTAIICACMPMLKTPLTVLFPRLFPRGSSADYYSAGSRNPNVNPAAFNSWGAPEPAHCSPVRNGENLRFSHRSSQEPLSKHATNIAMTPMKPASGIIKTNTYQIDCEHMHRPATNINTREESETIFPYPQLVASPYGGS